EEIFPENLPRDPQLGDQGLRSFDIGTPTNQNQPPLPVALVLGKLGEASNQAIVPFPFPGLPTHPQEKTLPPHLLLPCRTHRIASSPEGTPNGPFAGPTPRPGRPEAPHRRLPYTGLEPPEPRRGVPGSGTASAGRRPPAGQNPAGPTGARGSDLPRRCRIPPP